MSGNHDGVVWVAHRLLALDASVIALISLLICLFGDRTELMRILVPGLIAVRMLLWWKLQRRRRSHSVTAEIAFFSLCLILGGFNDWNTVVRHRVYDYTVPSDLLPWSSIPSWMLLYWGMILRFMSTLSASAWIASTSPNPSLQRRGLPPLCKGRLGGVEAAWKVPLELALVFSTRQSIYRFYEAPLLSWLPFAASLGMYLILFPPTRGEWRFVGLLALGGPLMESLYIRVGHLHHYQLGWIGGVPVWIALWWILAGLIWKDLSPRILILIAKAFPAEGEACGRSPAARPFTSHTYSDNY